MANVHYNVDHIAVSEGALFAWGWVFHREHPLSSARLRLEFRDGNLVDQPVAYGTHRDDVREAFPDIDTAGPSGFTVAAAWPHGKHLCAADLIIVDASGVSHTRPIWRDPRANRRSLLGRARESLRNVGKLYWIFRRALGLLRRGKFSVLREKILRYFANRPARVADPIQHLRQSLILNPERPALLVVDHDLGGGAPQYRKQLIEHHVSRGGTALLLTFHVPTLRYALQVFGAVPSERVALAQPEALLTLGTEGLIGDILFNNAVSFAHPDRIPDFLIRMKAATGGKLTLTAHDYQMLCPSHFLLDANGRFCNLPDIGICRTCLANNQEGFVSFFPERDITLWRKSWRRLIDDANEIVFFSNATLQLYRRVYPDLPLAKTSVKPHNMDYFPARRLPPRNAGTLHLGIVGHLGRHKGSAIVSGLARHIEKHRLDVRMTILGQIDEHVPSSVVHVTGPYTHAELAQRIETSGVNLLFVPSIFPETFSYVTHELMSTGYPIVSFDLGAQAEALRKYPYGHVIPLTEGEELLNALLAIHARINAAGAARLHME